MDKGKAIQLLKEALSEIPHLKELKYDDPEFQLWRDKVEQIIKSGLSQDDFKTFISTNLPILILDFLTTSTARQDNHLKRLVEYGVNIEKIIQKYKILGIDTKPATTAELEDTAELPIHLFDAMRLHPKVVKASRGLFKDKYYADAIFRAFTAVTNFVKEKSGQLLDGKQLMATVFNEDKPIIKINELLNKYDRDEQEGFKFLFMGGQVGIRNPKAHDNIVQTDPYRTLEYLGFASLLMKRIEEGKVVKL